WEEAGAKVGDECLYRLFDLPYINQVYIFYRSQLLDDSYSAGRESIEVKLFSESEIPWDKLAFPIVTQVLREYFDDRRSGTYPVRVSVQDPHWKK
ncbi:NUDIX hydrolase, partial [bacterium AH-315-K03]|nr:NUDIX hydrolase [bacterium AH-315-K03]